MDFVELEKTIVGPGRKRAGTANESLYEKQL